MAIKRLNQKYFYGGISDSEKIGVKGSYNFAKHLNIYDEPSKASVLPKTVKVSGSTVTGLVKWIVSGKPDDTNMYFYDAAGKIYKEASNGTWSVLQTTANSVGQGLEVHNDYLYYTQNTQIGRYGPLSDNPAFDDDWQTGLNDTSTVGFAPIKAFKEGVAVGHGNKMAWWDGSVWDVDALILPAGLNIRTIEVLDEYLVLGTWRGTDITDNEEGYLFFWDGSSTTFNFFVKIEEGACNAILNSKNRLFSILGSGGQLFYDYRPFVSIQRIPKMSIGKNAEIYPGAVTNWKNKIHIGVAGSSNNTELTKGVYVYGSISDKYPDALSFGYSMSTGSSTGANVKVGSLKGVGNELYIGWQDDTAYGVDKVTDANAPFTTAEFETLIFDDEQIFSDKAAQIIKVVHAPLKANETVQIGYKKNRAASYTMGDINDVDGSVETVFNVPSEDARFLEIQIECLITGTTTMPDIYYVGMEYDDLANEGAY